MTTPAIARCRASLRPGLLTGLVLGLAPAGVFGILRMPGKYDVSEFAEKETWQKAKPHIKCDVCHLA